MPCHTCSLHFPVVILHFCKVLALFHNLSFQLHDYRYIKNSLNQILIFLPSIYNRINDDFFFVFIYFIKYQMSFYYKNPITLFSQI